TTGSGANYLDRVDYGNDRAGNRTYRNIRVDQISGATTDQRDQAYSYDGLDRLIDTDEGTANDTTGAITTKTFEQHWKLDQLGNWEEFEQDDNGNGTWDLEQDRTHNDANEVTAIGLQGGGAGANWADPAFDAAGNMTTIPKPDTLTASYTGKFDAWNRLVSLNSGTAASYEYDGLNRRIKRVESSATTHFYYNEAWQCLEERSTEGGTATKQFVWGAQYVDELVLRDRDADANSGNGLEERLYALQEAQYNISALVNTSGSIQQRFAYTSYGVSNVLAADMSAGSDSYAWEHRYTGRRLDSGTGLQLNRNRYYHAQMGRWCSRDPIGFEGSEWNLYEYVNGSPANLLDPSGLAGNCFSKLKTCMSGAMDEYRTCKNGGVVMEHICRGWYAARVTLCWGAFFKCLGVKWPKNFKPNLIPPKKLPKLKILPFILPPWWDPDFGGPPNMC
ncbi:MAG: RHS repeat-associated core domain-containing protein, partial [Planctomycetota bacterium]